MTAFAVKFSITETSIDAYLQSDGTVEVHETHTYSFDGVFNGITRELIPKKGASIAQFAAYENGQALQTEREDNLYRVYRGGDSEAITVDLYYTIENGMAFYPDVGEFYWPFFDRRNKSDYERLTITIHPPEPTAAEVIAFGADEAFATETILDNGTVVFQLGHVPAGRNGDIRVAYDAGLFAAATLTSDQPMRDTILQAQQDGIERVSKSVHRQHRVEQIANYVLSMVTVILIVLVVRALVEVGHKRNVILRNLEGADRSAVPELVMSLPATLHVIHPNINLAHTLTSALLDLARQGYVERSSEQSFRQIHRESPHLHERILLKWLFDEMSGGEEFHFDDMETYVKKRENHQNYLSFKYNWRKAIKEEMKQHKVYKKSWPIRLFAAALFLVLAIFLIVMIVSQVSAWYYVWIVTLRRRLPIVPYFVSPQIDGRFADSIGMETIYGALPDFIASRME